MLPGIAHKAVRCIQEETDTSVIAGGLISEVSEVEEAINNGAEYITTSNQKLW